MPFTLGCPIEREHTCFSAIPHGMSAECTRMNEVNFRTVSHGKLVSSEIVVFFRVFVEAVWETDPHKHTHTHLVCAHYTLVMKLNPNAHTKTPAALQYPGSYLLITHLHVWLIPLVGRNNFLCHCIPNTQSECHILSHFVCNDTVLNSSCCLAITEGQQAWRDVV